MRTSLRQTKFKKKKDKFFSEIIIYKSDCYIVNIMYFYPIIYDIVTT